MGPYVRLPITASGGYCSARLEFIEGVSWWQRSDMEMGRSIESVGTRVMQQCLSPEMPWGGGEVVFGLWHKLNLTLVIDRRWRPSAVRMSVGDGGAIEEHNWTNINSDSGGDGGDMKQKRDTSDTELAPDDIAGNKNSSNGTLSLLHNLECYPSRRFPSAETVSNCDNAMVSFLSDFFQWRSYHFSPSALQRYLRLRTESISH